MYKVWVLRNTLRDSKSLSPIARGNSMKTTEMTYIHLYSCDKDNGYF